MAFAIRVTRHYYDNKTVKSYVTDGFLGERRAEFETRVGAQAVADQLDSAEYRLSHNEHSRPDYKVVRIRN